MPLDPSAPAVALTGVWRAFGDVVAVNDLTFDVPRGTVTVLLGPNGAGKTTVVRLVTGALHPDAGAVRTLGLDPNLAAEGTEARRRCGVVPARPALYDRLTGRDNLRYAAALFEVDPRLDRADASARRRRASGSPMRSANVSAATRRACARGSRSRVPVLHDPDLLLLDEPTAGLDPESARTVLGLIDEMAEDGKTVLMCTHLLARGRGARRPGDRDGPRPRHRRRLARRAHATGTGPRARVLLDADDPSVLDLARDLPFVRAFERNGTVTVDLDAGDRRSRPRRRARARPARASRASSRGRPVSRSSTSRSGSRSA